MNSKHTIYTKDKNAKISFRCDDALSMWVIQRSKVVGLTPSAFVRQMLYQQFYAEKTIGPALKEAITASTETAAKNANH